MSLYQVLVKPSTPTTQGSLELSKGVHFTALPVDRGPEFKWSIVDDETLTKRLGRLVATEAARQIVRTIRSGEEVLLPECYTTVELQALGFLVH